MEERSRFINPKRYGIWIAVSFGLALLALLTAVLGVRESRMGAVVTQVEALKLNDRILALERTQQASAPVATMAPGAK